ncbi:L-lactate dehydrogenase complex protein LldE [Scopulibacillus darangshiensis]|uniref:Lactate utilization protein A n=1 Tax=Scopulibacillus darangshiensis TaxID=442528 RepID=A0A4R2PA94_9BACL|nr:(Fe-S)-binding protein [Scopulibacillus darangshiensis]TCP31288.1 L-lactate dehydrogenase complex protein LldE [Scopulibacillus darangshiensis]
MKVSLFITCLGEIFYPNVGKDVVEILEREGCDIDFPAGQTCCGQPAYNSGYKEDAAKAAKQMIRSFEDSEYVVTPSGSCAAMVREYPGLFEENTVWHNRAEKVAAKTFELTQFIVNVLRKEDLGASYNARATYHTSCHMTRLLGEKEAPFKLLKHVKGLELIPLSNSYDCCGFGGTFAVKMGPISGQMVDEKVRHVEETDADILIGADNACLMNIKGRIDRRGKPIEVMHIAQILNHREEGEA